MMNSQDPVKCIRDGFIKWLRLRGETISLIAYSNFEEKSKLTDDWRTSRLQQLIIERFSIIERVREVFSLFPDSDIQSIKGIVWLTIEHMKQQDILEAAVVESLMNGNHCHRSLHLLCCFSYPPHLNIADVNSIIAQLSGLL